MSKSSFKHGLMTHKVSITPRVVDENNRVVTWTVLSRGNEIKYVRDKLSVPTILSDEDAAEVRAEWAARKAMAHAARRKGNKKPNTK